MDKFLEGALMRHACKVFDTKKQIQDDVFENILKVGYVAPSLFGLEPTRVMVVKNKKVREEIKPLCWNQEQITTASELLIFKTLKSDLLAHTNYVKDAFKRKEKSGEELKAYVERFGAFLNMRGLDDYTIGYWSALQSYIIATSMMDYTSYRGIDSCMLEGFEKNALEKYFGIDSQKEQITLLLALGYRVKPQSKRYRIDFHEFVKFI